MRKPVEGWVYDGPKGRRLAAGKLEVEVCVPAVFKARFRIYSVADDWTAIAFGDGFDELATAQLAAEDALLAILRDAARALGKVVVDA